MIFFSLLYNISILFVLVFLISILTKTLKSNQKLVIILQGILIGLVTIIGMKYSVELENGLIYDGRSIIICFGTMFFGPVVGLIAAIIGGIYRYSIGGVGLIPGILTFVISFAVGYIFFLLKNQDKNRWTSDWNLILMGFINHLGVVGAMLTLPKSNITQVFQYIAPIMLTIYPVFTWMLGKFQLYLEENEALSEQIIQERNQFRTTLYSIGDGLITTDIKGNVVTMNIAAEQLTGWTEADAIGKHITSILKLINENTRQPVQNPVEKVLQYGLVVGLASHTLLINKNGEEIPIADSGAPIKDEKGNITGVVFVFRDQIAEREYLKRILKNENDLKRAEKVAKIGYWELDVASLTLIGSDGAVEIFELDTNIIKREEFRKIVLPEFHPILDKAAEDLIYHNQPYDVYFSVITLKTKTKKYIRSFAEYDKEKNMVFGVLIDETERHLAKQKLEEQNMRYENIIKATNAGTWEWNLITNEVKYNNKWYEILGYSPQEFKNPNYETRSNLAHPEDLKRAEQLLNDHITGKTDFYSCEMRMKHKNGNWVWILDTGSITHRDKDGAPLWMFGLQLDITERMLAEEKLRENEEKFRLIVENQNDLVVKVNLNNEFEFVNKAYCELFGKSYQDLIGQSFTPLVHPEDLPKTLESMQDLYNPPYKCSLTQRALTIKGWRWLEWQDTSIIDSNGQMVSILGVGRDITEEKILNETLEFLGSKSWNLKFDTFFEEFLYFLNNYFPSDILLVGKIGENKTLETIKVIKDNELSSNFILKLSDIHCNDIFNERNCFNEINYCKELLSEQIFIENNITTYDGICLYDFEGKPIGVILLLSRNRIENKDILKNVLKASSSRCSAEIQRIQFEKSLEEQAKLYRALVENLPGFVYRCKNDMNWTMEFLSPQFEEITGYKLDEVLYNRVIAFNDLIHPDYQDYLWDKWQKSLAKSEVFEDEYIIITKDGQERIVWERGQGVFDENGNLICLEGFIADVTERKQSEAQLREIQNRLQLLNDNMVQGVVFLNQDEQITYANPSAQRILGLRYDQIIGKTPHDPSWRPIHEDGSYFPAETHPSLVALHTGKAVHNTIMGVFNPVDNQYKWLNINAIPNLNKNTNEVVDVLVTFEDVTESFNTRKKLEELYQKLQKSEERFRLAMEATSDGIWDWNLVTNEVYFSPNYFKMLGYEEGEFPNNYQTWLDLLHPDDREYAENTENQIINSGGLTFAVEFRMKTKNNDWRWILSRGKVIEWDANNNPIRQIGTHTDITDRKLYEEEIFKTKETYQNIFNTVKEAIYIQNFDGVFLDVNDSAVQMYGYPKSEIIGRTPEFLSAPGKNNLDNLRKTYEKLIQLGGTAQFEFWGRRANGEIFPKDVIVSRGKYFGQDVFIATARDITLQKQLIEELTEAKDRAIESDALKSAFLANMSHEIRTPMNAIIGFTQFLEDDELQPEEKKEYLSIINQKGKDLLQLIDDILDLSKIEAGQLTLFFSNGEISSVLYEVVKTFQSHKKFEEYHYDKKVDLRIGKMIPTPLECKTDFYRLNQVLNNLISNAMKFTDEGYVEVGYELLGNEIQFYVKDTGIGIHPESISKIFERFRQGDEYYHTRKYGGTGLGLSICKGIVDVLGGNIWVESEFGMGSTFFFTIKYNPIDLNQEGLVEKVKAPKPMKEKSINVLIAEDEDSNFQLIRRVLEKYYDVTIVHARNGQEAVNFCKNNDSFDVILMDIRMPIKSGVQAFKEIREKGITTPIIALTAYALIEERTKLQSAGFDGYISKPFKREDVISIFENLNLSKIK